MNSGGHDTAGMSVTEMSRADKCQSHSEARTDSAQAKNAFCHAALSSASKARVGVDRNNMQKLSRQS